MVVRESVLDLNTPTGIMRSYLYSPFNSHRPQATYPGLVLYSEIFQQTEPIRRLATQLSGRGYNVLVPEVYHEHFPPGTVLGYDEAGRNDGNRCKYGTKLSTFDADAKVALNGLKAAPTCNGKLGVFGVCLGGHLAFRAGFNEVVLGTACFFPTDIHTAMLGEGQKDDSLIRAGDIRGELMMVWGRQDPHIPYEGRRLIQETLHQKKVFFTWHEFNTAHAFMRDEGERFDPAATSLGLALAMDLFQRVLC